MTIRAYLEAAARHDSPHMGTDAGWRSAAKIAEANGMTLHAAVYQLNDLYGAGEVEYAKGLATIMWRALPVVIDWEATG